MQKKFLGMPLHYSLIAGAVLFVGWMIYLNTATMSPDALADMEARQQQRIAKEVEQKQKAKVDAITLLTDCEIKLKQTLKNPKSLEYKITSDHVKYNADDIRVSFPYRAENGFGGMTQGHALCIYDIKGGFKESEFN